jgi:hypothetical protein
MSARGWLGAAIVASIAGACAAEQHPAAQSAASPQSAHAEITQLWNDIDGQRTQLGVSNVSPMSAQQPANPVAAAASCPRPDNDRCSQTCTLSDSICGNAKRICELADQLVGDSWAAGKCGDAKQLCADATQRCCECT